jgi:hypothetical protein
MEIDVGKLLEEFWRRPRLDVRAPSEMRRFGYCTSCLNRGGRCQNRISELPSGSMAGGPAARSEKPKGTSDRTPGDTRRLGGHRVEVTAALSIALREKEPWLQVHDALINSFSTSSASTEWDFSTSNNYLIVRLLAPPPPRTAPKCADGHPHRTGHCRSLTASIFAAPRRGTALDHVRWPGTCLS